MIKPDEQWSIEEESNERGNSNALNAIFANVTENVFRHIRSCEIAKEAWDILQVVHGGTNKAVETELV